MEVDLKTKSRKNNLRFNTDQFLEKCHVSGFIEAPLEGKHVTRANHLIWNGDDEEHADPFDRVLLAQALTDDMMFLTHDAEISKFKQGCVILV